jgi:hypothetical protein
MRGNAEPRLVMLAGAAALAVAACGGGMLSSPDGGSLQPDGMTVSLDGGWPGFDGVVIDTASPGTCGDNVPAGQACNTLQNMESPLAPTCATGAVPTGTGGTIVDGTYILTSSKVYGDSCATLLPVAETLTIAGDCIQLVVGDILAGTFSGRFVTQGNAITTMVTCQQLNTDAAVLINDAASRTYTATGTSLTLFALNTDGTGDVAVFTRR